MCVCEDLRFDHLNRISRAAKTFCTTSAAFHLRVVIIDIQNSGKIIIIINQKFSFSFLFFLNVQLPIPPGLSVYGEPADETTSNIYESIDLQREYINPYMYMYIQSIMYMRFCSVCETGTSLLDVHGALLLPRLLTGHGCFPTYIFDSFCSTSFCFLGRLKPNALQLLHVSQRCNRRRMT